MATSPVFLFRPPFSSGSKFSAILRAYFRSGWAFFVPYLTAYLIYASLNGPVNPAENLRPETNSAHPVIQSGDQAFSLAQVLPPLLYVFWALHSVHLILATAAIVSWLQGRYSKVRVIGHRPEHSTADAPTGLILSKKAAPWLLLTLIFWLPGLYLEYPADTWAHYARITEWPLCQVVKDHSAWAKFSHILPFSLISPFESNAIRLQVLNLYCALGGLLLSWQYFQLARACALPTNAAVLFAIAQAFLLGNNAFTFVRYYGLSTTIVSQIGAIAILRVLTQFLRIAATRSRPRLTHHVSFATSLTALLLVTTFNHLQGFGIAAIGAFGLVMWRVSMKGWGAALGFMLLLTIASIGTITWFPKSTILTDIYREQGWLNSAYGFDILNPASRAFQRAVEVLALPGIGSVAAAILLIRLRHPAAWLTLAPIVVLVLPCFSIPLAHVIATRSVDPSNIVTFHRFLLGAPIMLAPIALFYHWLRTPNPQRQPVLLTASVATLGILVTLPNAKPFYGRFFHALVRPPHDLSMRHIQQVEPRKQTINQSPIISSSGVSFIIAATTGSDVAYGKRLLLHDAPSRIEPAVRNIEQTLQPALAAPQLIIDATHLFTPLSTLAVLTRHWYPQEVALEHAGMREISLLRPTTTPANTAPAPSTSRDP